MQVNNFMSAPSHKRNASDTGGYFPPSVGSWLVPAYGLSFPPPVGLRPNALAPIASKPPMPFSG